MSNQDPRQVVPNNDELELGPGAPNLHLYQDRNMTADRGIKFDIKYMIKSSGLRSIFHFAIMVVALIMYSESWCFLNKTELEKPEPQTQPEQQPLNST